MRGTIKLSMIANRYSMMTAVVLVSAFMPGRMSQVRADDSIEIDIQGEDFREAIKRLFDSRNEKFEMNLPLTTPLNPITVKLPPTEWEVAVKFLSEAAGVRYRKNNDGVFVFEPKSQSSGSFATSGASNVKSGQPVISSGSGTKSSGRSAAAAGPLLAQAPATVPAAPTLGGAESEEEKPRYERYEVKHIYSGGLALLFGGSSIPTMAVASPMSSVGGGGGSGGFGGSSGGFGGSSGGFGGSSGGFGGSSGGFGGGSSGGFGGSSGGFGGSSGGFGGSSGGGGGFGGGF